MVTIYLKRPGSEDASLSVDIGESLMQAVRAAGYEDIQALCGGNCACATCHVYVDPELWHRLPEMSEDEDSLLESSNHRTNYSRLSCQLIGSEEMAGHRIEIAPSD
jgi:2Fe-2S ferredoxin